MFKHSGFYGSFSLFTIRACLHAVCRYRCWVHSDLSQWFASMTVWVGREWIGNPEITARSALERSIGASDLATCLKSPQAAEWCSWGHNGELFPSRPLPLILSLSPSPFPAPLFPLPFSSFPSLPRPFLRSKKFNQESGEWEHCKLPKILGKPAPVGAKSPILNR